MTYTQIQNKKGFTLIELLIVIGILAVLATITVLVLNPAELFKQARDSQRLSDLSTIRQAINYGVGTGTITAFTANGPFWISATGACGLGTCTLRNSATTDGNGWVAINLDALDPNPLATLPRDPVTTGTQYAWEGAADLTFELDAVLESTKYAVTQDLDNNDGGNQAAIYEVGTNLSL